MVRINKEGQLVEPATKSELVEEVARLRAVLNEAMKKLRKFSRVEVDVIKIMLQRHKQFAQPDVGDPAYDGGRHFYDNPKNAGKSQS